MNKVMKTARKLLFKNSQISYYVMGNTEKETIIMLHPAFADHQIFELQSEYFQGNYQVILVDMPGHGQDQIMGSKVTLADMPEIINHLLSENNISSCHLLGVSLGSLVAQAYADRYPDRVKSIIVVGGYSIRKENKDIIKAQRKEGLKWMMYILFSMKKFRSYAASTSCYTPQGRDLFDRGIRYFTRKSFPAMSGMKTLITNKETPMPCPLLIIVGEHDLKLAQNAAIELHKLEKHSKLILLAEAGHCANVDAASEFNKAVEEFILSPPLLQQPY